MLKDPNIKLSATLKLVKILHKLCVDSVEAGVLLHIDSVDEKTDSPLTHLIGNIGSVSEKIQ